MNDQSDQNFNGKSNAPEYLDRRTLLGWLFLVIYVIVSGIPIWSLFITSSISLRNAPPEIVEKIIRFRIFSQIMIPPYLIMFLPFLMTSLHYLMRPIAFWSLIDGRVKRHVVWANILFFLGIAILTDYWVELHMPTPQVKSSSLIVAIFFLAGSLWCYIGTRQQTSSQKIVFRRDNRSC
ncbi:MAG: hypothetical protein ABSA64_08045 [Sedimentisphaerales bacterium]|jgi:hypothetical protein